MSSLRKTWAAYFAICKADLGQSRKQIWENEERECCRKMILLSWK